MTTRCPRSPAAGTGWIDGWRLTFGVVDDGREHALATIVEQVGSQVFVALYELSSWDLTELDRWESADIGAYRKIHVRIATLDGDMPAMVYVPDSYEGGLPSASYLKLIADAAQLAGAPDEYVSELRARPCQ